MIIFQNVSKIYKNNSHESVALEDVSFTINPKEFVSIVGKSGAGKSTIVKLLIAEEEPSKGRIIFGSYDVNKLKHSELPHLRRKIGVIFQDFRLLTNKNAYENVAYALEVAGRSQQDIKDVVPQVFEMVRAKEPEIIKETIHWSSFSKFVSGLVDEGKEIPKFVSYYFKQGIRFNKA